MAWTTPATPTAGQGLAASFWNEQVRDNLNALKAPPFQQMAYTGAAQFSSSASTAVPVDTANLSITLNTQGGDVQVQFMAFQNAIYSTIYGLNYDGTAWGGTGIFRQGQEAGMVSYNVWITGLASGNHTFRPTWWVPAGNLTTIDPTALPVVFWAREG